MQDTPETAELAKRAEEASQHAKQLRAELRKKRKADKLKLQQQLGAELLKFTDIETVSQLRSYFEKELNQEAQQDIEAQQLAIEVNSFADQLTWNEQRQYWQVADLRALTDWLATHRSRH
ncbi:hypothetical protein [Lactiplantibacillus plantarum]|uniref:hypothetical protein n=1 Tax=Lactiplantibacillus plantarum TaxID=1590 RepID=UPI00034E87E5|nr:hypothetical protein [Lactiplantibacillus plantarum]EPD25299.1 hypothetical protein L103_03398 [Lactiplantibacillus plantarum IPLA88]